jgi:hypothetical protein
VPSGDDLGTVKASRKRKKAPLISTTLIALPALVRDKFSAAVTRVLSERAAFICSRPECLELTVAPHSNVNKSAKTGEAAHITAAALGGPRYDPSLTHEDRSSIENAIWLCSNCATLIDKDAPAFPVDLLRSWKAQHEAWIQAGGAIASMPTVTVKSLEGFSVPTEGPTDVSAQENDIGREHRLLIELEGHAAITEFELICQFPEGVYRWWLVRRPVGVEVLFEKEHPDVITSGEVTTIGEGGDPPPCNWRLAIGPLYPGQTVDLRLRTSARRDIGPSVLSGPEHWLHGTYRWEYRGAPKRRKLTVVIVYDTSTRKITSLPATADPIHVIKSFHYP